MASPFARLSPRRLTEFGEAQEDTFPGGIGMSEEQHVPYMERPGPDIDQFFRVLRELMMNPRGIRRGPVPWNETPDQGEGVWGI